MDASTCGVLTAPEESQSRIGRRVCAAEARKQMAGNSICLARAREGEGEESVDCCGAHGTRTAGLGDEVGRFCW